MARWRQLAVQSSVGLSSFFAPVAICFRAAATAFAGETGKQPRWRRAPRPRVSFVARSSSVARRLLARQRSALSRPFSCLFLRVATSFGRLMPRKRGKDARVELWTITLTASLHRSLQLDDCFHPKKVVIGQLQDGRLQLLRLTRASQPCSSPPDQIPLWR